jgi:hypothetical protein
MVKQHKQKEKPYKQERRIEGKIAGFGAAQAIGVRFLINK